MNPVSEYSLGSNGRAVLPFTAVLTSGSAIQALGFGKPLVVPRLGCLPELVAGGAGLLYDPAAEGALAGALTAARSLDLGAARRAALRRTAELDWEPIAGRIAELYRGGGANAAEPRTARSSTISVTRPSRPDA